MEEFVTNFFECNELDELVPIDVVSEVTGLAFDEIRKCYDVLVIEL